MDLVEINEVRISEDGKLFIKPTSNPSKVFKFVYRAAMEVYWDEDTQCFYTPKPREWTYLDWYKQVLAAVVSEMGVQLSITENTDWKNIPVKVQQEIEQYDNEKTT